MGYPVEPCAYERRCRAEGGRKGDAVNLSAMYDEIALSVKATKRGLRTSLDCLKLLARRRGQFFDSASRHAVLGIFEL